LWKPLTGRREVPPRIKTFFEEELEKIIGRKDPGDPIRPK